MLFPSDTCVNSLKEFNTLSFINDIFNRAKDTVLVINGINIKNLRVFSSDFLNLIYLQVRNTNVERERKRINTMKNP